jgi:hypothetical protein
MSIRIVILSLSCLAVLANIINDDNYIRFSEGVHGSQSIPSRDGYLYSVGSSVSKIKLTDHLVEKRVRIQSGGNNVEMGQGALTYDGTQLVISRPASSGGPNCRPFVVLRTSDLTLVSTNCLGIVGDTVFSLVMNDFSFLPKSSTVFIGCGSYIDYINNVMTLFVFKASLETSSISLMNHVRTAPDVMPPSGSNQGFTAVRTSNIGDVAYLTGKFEYLASGYVTVMKVGEDLLTIQWVKQLKQLASSAL